MWNLIDGSIFSIRVFEVRIAATVFVHHPYIQQSVFTVEKREWCHEDEDKPVDLYHLCPPLSTKRHKQWHFDCLSGIATAALCIWESEGFAAASQFTMDLQAWERWLLRSAAKLTQIRSTHWLYLVFDSTQTFIDSLLYLFLCWFVSKEKVFIPWNYINSTPTQFSSTQL